MIHNHMSDTYVYTLLMLNRDVLRALYRTEAKAHGGNQAKQHGCLAHWQSLAWGLRTATRAALKPWAWRAMTQLEPSPLNRSR